MKLKPNTREKIIQWNIAKGQKKKTTKQKQSKN